MNLESYLEAKLSNIMIYHHFAHFEKSSMECIPDRRLPILRLILGIAALITFITSIIFDPYEGMILTRLVTDIELYALFFAVLSFIFAHNAARVNSDQQIDKTSDLKKKKNALIINEIAISLNVSVCLIYFVYLPIVYGSRAFD